MEVSFGALLIIDIEQLIRNRSRRPVLRFESYERRLHSTRTALARARTEKALLINPLRSRRRDCTW